MPFFGTYLKEHDRDFYDRAHESRYFNFVKALAAGRGKDDFQFTLRPNIEF
jgi:hypothetical protein